jgi:hypothetical protein
MLPDRQPDRDNAVPISDRQPGWIKVDNYRISSLTETTRLPYEIASLTGTKKRQDSGTDPRP